MSNTHVLNPGRLGVESPLDGVPRVPRDFETQYYVIPMGKPPPLAV